jgi:hypothetical protein
MDDEGRLIMAELGAEVLIADLHEILKHTQNLPLKELIAEALEQVEKLRRRLKLFASITGQE